MLGRAHVHAPDDLSVVRPCLRLDSSPELRDI